MLHNYAKVFPMTVQETNDAYAKKDCFEKVFQALKNHIGMDKIGVTSRRGYVW
jgi:hypothetical protein